jgi:hypothetical protein
MRYYSKNIWLYSLEQAVAAGCSNYYSDKEVKEFIKNDKLYI